VPSSLPTIPPALDGAGIRLLTRAADSAVSVLPHPPWRLVAGVDGLEFHADRRRIVPVTDGYSRLLKLSCGTALFNLRLALRGLGHEPVVRLLPRSADPSLIASVRIAGPIVHPLAEDRLAALLDVPVPAPGPGAPSAVLTGTLHRRLEEEALLEGCLLRVLGPAESERAWALVGEAGSGVGTPGSGPGSTPLEQSGLLAVIATVTDERADWLRAGQALQRVVLAAAEAGVRVTLSASPWACKRTVGLVRTLTSGREHPQMLMRVGG
jgi:hypothetical protein